MATRSPVKLEITTHNLLDVPVGGWRSELLVNDQVVRYFDAATEIEAFELTEQHVRAALGELA